MGGRSMKDVGGAVLAGSTPPFLGRERAAVDVDVGPERRSPRYHETCLALESVEEGSAAVSEEREEKEQLHFEYPRPFPPLKGTFRASEVGDSRDPSL